ncbi:MAG: hypothetical protein HY445_00950 [Candidatus Niyogibacteria bacterium]|nr:hypothetical protein [Candidatus Niyogibacteria bacterium]
MNAEKVPLPQNNELPLNIRESKKHTEGLESIVWKTLVQNKDEQEKLVALKQIKREQFATDEEMRKSKEFYDFLKGFPKFSKFVPDTLYFKARMSSGEKVGGYALQHFWEGKSLDKIKDEELYKDPDVVRQLLEFANAASEILQKTRKEKIPKPDFYTAYNADTRAVILGTVLANPRYSTNVVISEKPNENGQRVFFIDTGVNSYERMSKIAENYGREIGGRLQELQFKRWAGKLQKILENGKIK